VEQFGFSTFGVTVISKVTCVSDIMVISNVTCVSDIMVISNCLVFPI